MQVSKEGAGWDGEYTGPNTGNTLRAETLVNPDNEGDFANDVDRLVKGVEVQLFEQVNGVLNPEPISITVTDEDGKYIFYGLDLAKKYTLKFVYNGLMFQTTTYNPDLKGNHSNITEQQADRDVFNQNFAEIAAYPNNYPVRVELFKAPGEYNQSWSIEDLTQKDDSLYYQWVDKAYEIVKQQRDQDKFKPVNDGSKPVSPFILAAQQLATDDETRSQLQFLMDARIDAWTGDNSNLNNPGGLKYYPEIPAGSDSHCHRRTGIPGISSGLPIPLCSLQRHHRGLPVRILSPGPDTPLLRAPPVQNGISVSPGDISHGPPR